MKEHKEKLSLENKRLPFRIYRPGGNDTCIIDGIITDAKQKKRINDLVMEAFPNVEQVGFINSDQSSPRLEMAGGEFCGNATRSTAWESLSGKPGELSMRISGVNGTLRAGVTEFGEAFAQMPIYPETSKVTPDIQPGNFIVEMEGITHVIDTRTSLKELSQDEIKQKAKKTLLEKGLLEKYPASGVMYTRFENGKVIVDPVVYVRDIDTLFYETACGSGTTALGLILALQQGSSIRDIAIFQPSGLPIKVSVQYDGKQFENAQISGPIEELSIGTIELGEKMDYIMERINGESNKLPTQELTKLYNKIFGGPPYFERFTEIEVNKKFSEYARKGLLFLAKAGQKIIGFGAALPLTDTSEIAEITSLEATNTWYMENFPTGSTVLMRTSINNLASQSLYKSLGFQQLPDVYQEVEQTRTDGTITTDKRLFLTKQI